MADKTDIELIMKKNGYLFGRYNEKQQVVFEDIGRVDDFYGHFFVKRSEMAKYLETGKKNPTKKYFNCPEKLIDLIEREKGHEYIMSNGKINHVSWKLRETEIIHQIPIAEDITQLKKCDIYSIISVVKEDKMKQLAMIRNGLENYASEHIKEVLDELAEILDS